MRRVLLVCALLASPAFAAPKGVVGGPTADFRAVAPVRVIPGEGLQRLELPWSILQYAKTDELADVRVFDQQGDAAPIALIDASTIYDAAPEWHTVQRFPWPNPETAVQAAKVSVNTAGAVIEVTGMSATDLARPVAYLLDLSTIKQPVSALTLDWVGVSTGASVEATVDSSTDLSDWRALSGGLLLDTQAGGQRIAQQRINLPRGRYRYLRIWLTGTPLTITKAQVLISAQVPPANQVVKINAVPSGELGEWTLSFGRALGLESLAVTLPQQNTVTQLRLASRQKEDGAWQPRGDATVYRLLRGGNETTSAPMMVQGAPARYWRIQIAQKNGFKKGAALPVNVGMRPVVMVFAMSGKAPFTLAVGQADASAEWTKLSDLIPQYRVGAELALPLAQLGPTHLNVLAQPSAWQRLRAATLADYLRWILWLCLLGALGVLGYMAWSLRQALKEGASGVISTLMLPESPDADLEASDTEVPNPELPPDEAGDFVDLNTLDDGKPALDSELPPRLKLKPKPPTDES